MAYDYAYMEGYELQQQKSVVLSITHKQCKQEHNNLIFALDPSKMPSVESATHLGIIRTTSLKGNMTATVEENKKEKQGHVWLI
jgi:hypothetical protein